MYTAGKAEKNHIVKQNAVTVKLTRKRFGDFITQFLEEKNFIFKNYFL